MEVCLLRDDDDGLLYDDADLGGFLSQIAGFSGVVYSHRSLDVPACGL